ncbi:MAG: DUF4910 domain-containing protein [Deferribacteraceae bacterium]|jgi:aminoglycoside 3-N-acetyltransferase|nr:DUF4910 domain-containing protein [Deferribacteraceae bacterium]
MDYIEISNIGKQLPISGGDTVFVSSNISVLAKNTEKNGKKFDPDGLIDSLIDAVGKNGTLIFSTYNWDFCKGIAFDYKKTPGQSGFLGNTALRRSDFKRTKHPIYSFAVYGKDQGYLCGLGNTDSFASDSPFQYFYDNHAKSLSIGLALNDYYTFSHFIEQKLTVPFRFIKYFEGDYTDDNNFVSKRRYSMYVRHLERDVVAENKELYAILLKNGVACQYIINGVTFTAVDMHKSYEYYVKDITENNSKFIVSYKGQFEKEPEPPEIMYKICRDILNSNKNSPADIFAYLNGLIPELTVLNYNGEINYAEAVILGENAHEIIFTAYISHPSVTESELSGIAVAVALAKYIKSLMKRRHTYKFVFVEVQHYSSSTCLCEKHCDEAIQNKQSGLPRLRRGNNGQCKVEQLYKETEHSKEYLLADFVSAYAGSEDNPDFISEKSLAGIFELAKRCVDSFN